MEPGKILQTQDISVLKLEYQKLAQKEHYFRIINEFSVILLHKQTEEEILWAVAKNAIAKMGFSDCVIYLLDDEQQILVQKAAHGPKNPAPMDIKNPITIELGKGIVGTVALTGQMEIIGDTSKDHRYILDDDFRYSEIAVPIKMGDKVIGVIDSEHHEKNFYTKEDGEILTTIAAFMATKLLHAKAAEKVNAYQKNLESEIEVKTKELKEIIAKLEKSNQDLESFAYATAHDLQEPLRSISGYLQLLQRKHKEELDEQSTHFLESAVAGAGRMKTLLEDILQYSRVSYTNESHLPIDLNEIINTVKENLEVRLHQNQVEIQVLQPLSTIYGIPAQIIQLFQNIIGNSIKFREVTRPPLIKIKEEQLDQHLKIYICDNGIGISENYHQKVFKIFSKLHSLKDYSGSGIGLALCKRIVEMHGGQIGIESQFGHGTCIHFTLPLTNS